MAGSGRAERDAHISESRYGAPGWSARAVGASGLHPTLRKGAKDGAPEHLWGGKRANAGILRSAQNDNLEGTPLRVTTLKELRSE